MTSTHQMRQKSFIPVWQDSPADAQSTPLASVRFPRWHWSDSSIRDTGVCSPVSGILHTSATAWTLALEWATIARNAVLSLRYGRLKCNKGIWSLCKVVYTSFEGARPTVSRNDPVLYQVMSCGINLVESDRIMRCVKLYCALAVISNVAVDSSIARICMSCSSVKFFRHSDVWLWWQNNVQRREQLYPLCCKV